MSTTQRVGMDRSRLKRFINQRLSELPLEAPVFVSPGTSVRKAVALMQEGSQPCVLAGDESKLTGIFTERDLLLKCTADDFDWEQPLDAAVLTREPRTISARQTVAEAIAAMQQFNYRTLPVVDDGRVIGLVRLGGLLTQLAEAFPEDVLNLPPRPHQVMEKREGG
ncbi:MAG: CBS domain-containing protein [Thermoflexaceae bacterium]|nr:CBS domain-containing protein [Thermoflexaceae bacterium]